MTSTASPNGRTKGGRGQGIHCTTRRGMVTGAVLRGARLSAGISEAGLAAASGLDEDSIRSWGDGSSSLASVPLPDVEIVESALRDAGADPRLVDDLAVAAWCDLVLLAAIGSGDVTCLLADPVTSEDAFGDLLTWCLAGRVPTRYSPYAEAGPLLADSALAHRAAEILAPFLPLLAAACRLAS